MSRRSSFHLEWQGYTPRGELVTMYAKYIERKDEDSSYTLRVLTHDAHEESLIVRSEDHEGLSSMSAVDQYISQLIEQRDLVAAEAGLQPAPVPVMQRMF